jgi:hypothetical protein
MDSAGTVPGTNDSVVTVTSIPGDGRLGRKVGYSIGGRAWGDHDRLIQKVISEEGLSVRWPNLRIHVDRQKLARQRDGRLLLPDGVTSDPVLLGGGWWPRSLSKLADGGPDGVPVDVLDWVDATVATGDAQTHIEEEELVVMDKCGHEARFDIRKRHRITMRSWTTDRTKTEIVARWDAHDPRQWMATRYDVTSWKREGPKQTWTISKRGVARVVALESYAGAIQACHVDREPGEMVYLATGVTKQVVCGGIDWFERYMDQSVAGYTAWARTTAVASRSRWRNCLSIATGVGVATVWALMRLIAMASGRRRSLQDLQDSRRRRHAGRIALAESRVDGAVGGSDLTVMRNTR